MKKAIFTKQFTASFTAETYDRIKAITDLKRISMGEWLRMAAEEKLTNMNNNNILKGENIK